MKNRYLRNIILFLLNTSILLLSYFLILLYATITKDKNLFSPEYINCIYNGLIYLGCFSILFFVFKINRITWKYASYRDYFLLFLAILISCFIACITSAFFLPFNLPIFSTYILICIVTYLFVYLGLRLRQFLFLKSHRQKLETKETQLKNAMIIGAGWTGNTLTKELVEGNGKLKPICILDDDIQKLNMSIKGISIIGTCNEIEKIVKEKKIDVIIFAIPSLEKNRKKEILNECMKTHCQVKYVPNDLVMNAELSTQIKDINIEDLLGRESITFDFSKIKSYITNKVCLVTGGGGSIGSELCRQIARCQPKQLLIVDIYENTTYEIQQELKRNFPKLNLIVNIFSIADYPRLRLFFEQYHPDIIVHAAAHKHVPLMEDVPEEAVKNNIVSTKNVCSLANEFNVSKFILISTDKAVNPTNVMGATKRCCELIVHSYAQKSKNTKYCAVRFGNVLGSHGSVIPLFKEQIKNGGPVTITDKKIIRYFMTISEAVSLVLKCGELANNGELFVLDMGQPVKILTLAENMIRLSGYEPYKDIDIKEIGLRPGEKLYEELLLHEEGLSKTKTEKILVCHQMDFNIIEFSNQLDRLINVANTNNTDLVLTELKNIIPTFHHKTNVIQNKISVIK